ncbi:MAG: hypothetical protein QXY62_05840 [Candidatus Altiarchaeota archaeon]
MRFEVEGNTKAILEALEKYKQQFHEEYERQIKPKKETIKGLGMTGSNLIPDKLDIFFWEENGKVIINIPIYMPKFAKWFGITKAMSKNFENFFKELGTKAKVKYLGD